MIAHNVQSREPHLDPRRPDHWSAFVVPGLTKKTIVAPDVAVSSTAPSGRRRAMTHKELTNRDMSVDTRCHSVLDCDKIQAGAMCQHVGNDASPNRIWYLSPGIASLVAWIVDRTGLRWSARS